MWFSSLVIGGIVIILWLIFLPFWGTVAGLLNSNGEVVNLSMKAMGLLIIPYILLALNLVTDSIFYGVRRTRYMAYQAILTNGTVYVIAFIAYLNGVADLTGQVADFTGIPHKGGQHYLPVFFPYQFPIHSSYFLLPIQAEYHPYRRGNRCP